MFHNHLPFNSIEWRALILIVIVVVAVESNEFSFYFSFDFHSICANHFILVFEVLKFWCMKILWTIIIRMNNHDSMLWPFDMWNRETEIINLSVWAMIIEIERILQTQFVKWIKRLKNKKDKNFPFYSILFFICSSDMTFFRLTAPAYYDAIKI